MAKRVQLIRHVIAAAVNFLGKEGEITVDLTGKSLRVHDGVTPGGKEQATADMSNVPDATASAPGRMATAQVAQLTANTANIATNAADIAANLAAIIANDSDILTNANAITALIAQDLLFLLLDGSRPMTGALAMGANKVTGVAAGTANTDAATIGEIETLLNKILTAPKIIGGGVLDSAGNELVGMTEVASAVNYVELINAITGQAAKILAAGDDVNIGLEITPKGTGGILLKAGTPVVGVINSDTMAGAAVNNLTSALAVKNYIDNIAESSQFDPTQTIVTGTTVLTTVGSFTIPADTLKDIAGNYQRAIKVTVIGSLDNQGISVMDVTFQCVFGTTIVSEHQCLNFPGEGNRVGFVWEIYIAGANAASAQWCNGKITFSGKDGNTVPNGVVGTDFASGAFDDQGQVVVSTHNGITEDASTALALDLKIQNVSSTTQAAYVDWIGVEVIK
jgi:hypothetical protein